MSDKVDNKPMKFAKLVWKDDSGTIQEFILNQGITTYVGREKGNNILLSNPKVSKRHASIHWKDNAFLITDQGSSNGTLVNGTLILEPTVLKDGDRVEIGDHVLSFYAMGEVILESLKTRPLSDLQGAQGLPAEAKTQILFENLETMAQPGAAIPTEKPPSAAPEFVTSAATVALPAEKEELKEDLMETRPKPAKVEPEKPPPAEPPKPVGELQPAAEEAPEELVSHLEDAFSELLQNIQAAQTRGKVLKDKGLGFKAGVEASISQLHMVSQEMRELEMESNNANLVELLAKLTNNPTDVTLLMGLSQHAPLMGKILKDYTAQGIAVGKIKDKLDIALRNYVS
jgi:pSer/pThr/pTyr-binding forkhead associated (FHA) protein